MSTVASKIYDTQSYKLDEWTMIKVSPLIIEIPSTTKWGKFDAVERGIHFQCFNISEKVAADMQHIYKKCTENGGLDAKEVMARGLDSKSDDATTGMSGNIRQHLWECRCPLLDRVRYPKRRKAYEDKVIGKIVKLIKEQKKYFTLKLALFCSGGLLGEEILLFRLFEKLKSVGIVGTIYLFLIDYNHRNAIDAAAECFKKKAYKSSDEQQGPFCLPDAVGKQHGLAQFLLEITKCLPQEITLSGNAFYDSQAYIQAMKSNPSFKHDLLVGADMEGSDRFMRPVQIQSESPHNAIALDTTAEGKTVLYEIDALGKAINRQYLDDL